jgi:hypothetical protein
VSRSKTVMDPIWQNLPYDLVYRIVQYLDATTRRDLGLKPLKLKSIPQLDLHFQDFQIFDDSSFVVIAKDDIFTSFSYCNDCIYTVRSVRKPFMTVEGIQVYRSSMISEKFYVRPQTQKACLL